VIAEYFDKKRGIATGITMAGSGVGSFVFSPFIGYLIKNYDWKFTFSICACIILQTVVCGALMRPLKPQPVDPADKAKQV
jgi:MFS family permease